ncbi:MAG: nucleotidyltransferase family protein [Gammaproteobacteria bacterium]|nr:nucleotidyltransferase family protein [Gammaproteobacteria bacterium]
MTGSSRLRNSRVAALLLAAGEGSRFGALKQLAVLDGESLVLRAARAAAAAVDAGVWVVTGAGHDDVAQALRDEAATLVRNADWRAGMGSSIRCGIRALNGKVDAVLITLADQPGVGAADLARLVACWREAPDRPAAALIAGLPGAPAVVPARWFPALLDLADDAGARELLRSGIDYTAVDLPAAADDIDTPSDLHSFAQRLRLSPGEPGT